MLNQLVLVGRLTGEVEVKELEDGKRVSHLVLAVPRSFKNAEGEYETDFIDCVIWNTIADNVKEYCKKGDLIGIKGRIQTRNINSDNDNVSKITEIIAEKVTFLSSKKAEE